MNCTGYLLVGCSRTNQEGHFEDLQLQEGFREGWSPFGFGHQVHLETAIVWEAKRPLLFLYHFHQQKNLILILIVDLKSINKLVELEFKEPQNGSLFKVLPPSLIELRFPVQSEIFNRCNKDSILEIITVKRKNSVEN